MVDWDKKANNRDQWALKPEYRTILAKFEGIEMLDHRLADQEVIRAEEEYAETAGDPEAQASLLELQEEIDNAKKV
jgi:hypothetical protein